MNEFRYLQLDQNEVDKIIKDYVIEKGYKPKKNTMVHMTKNVYGLSSGVKVTLEQEIKEEK